MPISNPFALPDIADAILALSEKYHSGNDELRSFVDDIVYRICRKLELFVVPQVSQAAASEADRLGVTVVKMRRCDWHHQHNWLRDPGRKIFHWDHIFPVRQMTNKVLADRISREEIIDIIARADVAWITKIENKRLDKSGFKSIRPDRPLDAYDKCDIKLVPL